MNWTKVIPEDFRRADSNMLRRFGLLMAGPLILVAAFLLWKNRDAGFYWGGAAVLLAGLGLLWPGALRSAYIVWMTFAYYLSFVTTYIILTLLYYLALAPAGLIARLFGKDLLDRRFPGGRSSYWVDSQKYEDTIERYSKPY
jgi:hypothetical protein